MHFEIFMRAREVTGNSYRNVFCFEKAEFKGMKNESGEINVGAYGGGGGLLGDSHCPEGVR